MNEWGYDDNASAGLDNDNNNDGPKALRDAYAALKKQNEELNGKLTSFLEEQNKQKVAGVFESLGIPQAAQVYQGEADPEKAKAWAESMQAVFGSGNAGGNAPVANTPAPAISQEQEQRYQAVTEAGATGQPLSNMDAAHAAVGNANNINDLIEAFKRGSQMG